MKKWDKWKKRILVFVVTGCMLLDSDMAVLAEETQKVVSNLYDEYQTEQLYKKQYEEIAPVSRVAVYGVMLGAILSSQQRITMI